MKYNDQGLPSAILTLKILFSTQNDYQCIQQVQLSSQTWHEEQPKYVQKRKIRKEYNSSSGRHRHCGRNLVSTCSLCRPSRLHGHPHPSTPVSSESITFLKCTCLPPAAPAAITVSFTPHQLLFSGHPSTVAEETRLVPVMVYKDMNLSGSCYEGLGLKMDLWTPR